MNTSLVLCLVGIAVAIFLGYKFNIHIGVVGMIFAFFIGNLTMGLKINTIIGYWPTQIAYHLIVTTCFYGFAKDNGTMDNLGKRLFKLIKGNVAILPAFIAVTWFLASIAGAQLIFILGPAVYAMAIAAGVDILPVALAMSYAGLLGGDNIWTGRGGIVSMGLIQAAGFENFKQMALLVYVNDIIKNIIIIAIPAFVYKYHKAKKVKTEEMEIEPLTDEQKKTAWIIAAVMFLIFVPQLLKSFIPTRFTKLLADIFVSYTVFPLGMLANMVLKVGNMRKAAKNIPMDTIILIGGMTMLMNVAVEAGLADAIAGLISENVPKFLIPGAIVLAAGFTSFFSSGTSVVCPLLYPIAASISAATGINPIVLFNCVFCGAMTTSASPFSQGGSSIQAVCPTDKSDHLAKGLMKWCAINIVIVVIYATIGGFSWLPALCGGSKIIF